MSYAGLNPVIRESGDSRFEGEISKKGSEKLRWILVQCSRVAVHRSEDEYLSRFYWRPKNRKSGREAIVATARKLLVSAVHEASWVNGLLSRLMQPDQAANELAEEQVLNFLVNTLNEEIDIGLDEPTDIDSEDIWDALVGATADEDSVSHLCEISEESPHGNTILHHLRTKFDLSELK